MPLKSKKSRVVLFFVFGVGLALLMAGVKAVIAWAAHTYLYAVPWLGGFLRSIELLEISNLLVFAVLGAGVGAATVWLPRRWTHSAKLAFLLILSPFVFSASYMMQQNLWIKEVAKRGSISYLEAREVTNTYLKRETGTHGFWGFYPFSTQLAELPTQLETLRSEQAVNPNDLLTQELSSYNDSRAELAAYVFEHVGWLIRFMYMTIAALTGLIYYFKGHTWAENRALSVSPAQKTAPARTARKKPPSTPQKAKRQHQKTLGSASASSHSSVKPSGHKPVASASKFVRGSSGSGSSINTSINPSSKPEGTTNNLPRKPISKPYRKAPSEMPLNGAAPNKSQNSSNSRSSKNPPANHQPPADPGPDAKG
ncbi:MAG: hypothetical protein AAGB19_09400 [Cyanobacteria bacterium P01_F01_bin.3]